MQDRRNGRTAARHKGPEIIKTTFLELIDQLASLTSDDRLVLRAVKHIFATHKITAIRSLAPVRLVSSTGRPRGKTRQRRPCWEGMA